MLPSPQMAAIAVHRETGIKYIVLGGGVRMFSPTHPLAAGSFVDPAARAAAKPVPVTMIVVCDAEGALVWFRSEELVVVEIDGAPPAAILTTQGAYR